MAAVQPASHIQAVNSPADSFRRVHQDVLRGGSGVVNYPGDMQVTQTGTPSMAVVVAAGRCAIPGTQNTTYQGSYDAMSDAAVTLTINAADPTNPRIDIICASVQDAAYSGAANQWLLQVVQGTPAASPGVPTAPANTVTLAQVRVNAAASSIVTANITDVRPALANTAQLSGQYVAAGGNGGGLSAFTVNSRFLGMLAAAGPPLTGTYVAGDWGYDSNFNTWICTASGTPGTWRASGPHLVTTLSGASPTYDFTSILQSYRSLELKCKLRDNSGATGPAFVDLTFNGDVGNNYNQEVQVADASSLAASESLARANIQAMLTSGGGQGAGCYCSGTIEIASYTDTNSRKGVIARIAQDGGDATTNTSTRVHTGRWKTSNAAVTRVTLTPEQGTGYDANSYAELWGLP